MPKHIRFHNRLAEARNRHYGRVYDFPLAFTMAMEIIIRASKWVVGEERHQDGMRLTPIRAYCQKPAGHRTHLQDRFQYKRVYYE